MRGGACNIVPRGYSGAWHYEGEQKCKGDPPRNNNNGRGSAMNYQVKAFSPNGGKRRTRKGGAKRRNTRRRRVGGTASSSASNASAVGTGTFANGRSGPIGANGRLPTGPGAFDKW